MALKNKVQLLAVTVAKLKKRGKALKEEKEQEIQRLKEEITSLRESAANIPLHPFTPSVVVSDTEEVLPLFPLYIPRTDP